MNAELRLNKAIVRDFLREQYSDANLAAMLDHCRAGKLEFTSCCCLIGAITATHPLQEEYLFDGSVHLAAACKIVGAQRAETAFCRFADGEIETDKRKHLRIRRLIPLLKSEIRRRMRLPASDIFTQSKNRFFEVKK